MQDSPIRLAVLHRNRLLRQCLISALQSEGRLELLAFDHDDANVADEIIGQDPEIALIDVGLADNRAIEVMHCLRNSSWNGKLIIILSAVERTKIAECLESTPEAWLHEESSLEEVRNAIESVLAGRPYYSVKLVNTVFAHVAELTRGESWREHLRENETTLTPRELEVLTYVSEGESNKAIATRLSLSPYTIKNHVHNIIEKLQVENRQAAVLYAYERRWLTK